MTPAPIAPQPDPVVWTDWALSAVSGAAGAIVGFIGLYVVFLLTRKADRDKQRALDQATEERRVLQYRVDAVITLSEAIRDLAYSWSREPAVDVEGWGRRMRSPIGVEFETLGVRMLVDAPEFAKYIRFQAEKLNKFEVTNAQGVEEFADRADHLYEWVLRWAADPSIIHERPDFFS